MLIIISNLVRTRERKKIETELIQIPKCQTENLSTILFLVAVAVIITLFCFLHAKCDQLERMVYKWTYEDMAHTYFLRLDFIV